MMQTSIAMIQEKNNILTSIEKTAFVYINKCQNFLLYMYINKDDNVSTTSVKPVIKASGRKTLPIITFG
jgi:hypothetical protein